MTKVIAILISAIFFFGLGDEMTYFIKKSSLLRVHQGLPPLSSFTAKMTVKKPVPRNNIQNSSK